jgi:vacuolar-type H+-ATPase subunit E/Vma4
LSAETVVSKIEEKANAEIKAIRDSAELKAGQAKSQIIGDAENKAKEIVEFAKTQSELTVKRAEQQARLEKRIGDLDHKHELLNKVRSDAKRVMLTFDEMSWISLYDKLISENAVTGEVKLSVPNSDRARYADGKLLKKWSDSVTSKTGTKTIMTLSDKAADIDGGLILCGEKYDVDLSYDALLDEAFAKNEKAIADKLF